jgi:hypothetical protein
VKHYRSVLLYPCSTSIETTDLAHGRRDAQDDQRLFPLRGKRWAEDRQPLVMSRVVTVDMLMPSS